MFKGDKGEYGWVWVSLSINRNILIKRERRAGSRGRDYAFPPLSYI